ncbi:MAG: hypothetical protein U0Y82_06400 [Thermoleophilia bacterium]
MTDFEELRRANEVWWVPLPPGAESPVIAYVNGQPRSEGDGITVRDGRVEFDPPLHARPRMGFKRSTMLFLGVGVYGDLRGDSLDLTYHRDGRIASKADITLQPTPPHPG